MSSQTEKYVTATKFIADALIAALQADGAELSPSLQTAVRYAIIHAYQDGIISALDKQLKELGK